MKDFELAKLLVDLKVNIENPIVGEKALTVVIELSRMDVERGYIESQVHTRMHVRTCISRRMDLERGFHRVSGP